jgi:hypothetical protein
LKREAETLAGRRARSIREVTGSLTGAYIRGYLEKLRAE